MIWTPSRVNGLVSIRDEFFTVLLSAPPAFSPYDAPELFLPSGFLAYVMWILWLLLWQRFRVVARGTRTAGHPALAHLIRPNRMFSELRSQMNSTTIMHISY